jgi:multiple sugar transport system permease protein
MSAFESKTLGRTAPAAAMLIYGLLGLWTLIVIFPIYWLAVTSVKIRLDVTGGPFYLPFLDFTPSGHAWHYIFNDLGNDTFRPYFNSIVVACFSTLCVMIIGTAASYALARLSFKPRLVSILIFIGSVMAALLLVAQAGLEWRIAVATALALFLLIAWALARVPSPTLTNADILFWLISQRIFPPVVAAIPIYVMFQHIGLLDTHAGLILAYVTVNLPIVIWLMYDFFVSIPRDLDESAELDGASKFRVFWDIVLPLARPGLVATSLLVFIFAWNEYLLALFLSTANAQTIPILVSAQNGTRGPEWEYMSVLILIMILPVIAMTLLLQRFIAKGLLLGAMKG